VQGFLSTGKEGMEWWPARFSHAGSPIGSGACQPFPGKKILTPPAKDDFLVFSNVKMSSRNFPHEPLFCGVFHNFRWSDRRALSVQLNQPLLSQPARYGL
jgi:hypothetical protein